MQFVPLKSIIMALLGITNQNTAQQPCLFPLKKLKLDWNTGCCITWQRDLKYNWHLKMPTVAERTKIPKGYSFSDTKVEKKHFGKVNTSPYTIHPFSSFLSIHIG